MTDVPDADSNPPEGKPSPTISETNKSDEVESSKVKELTTKHSDSEPGDDVKTKASQNDAPQATAVSVANSNYISTLEQQLLKAKKDLESMVLRYARSEKDNLTNKNKVDELDKKLKRAVKDNDQLANRIKILTNDKNQLTDTLNAKVAQLTVLEQKNCYLVNVQGDRLKECEEKLKNYENLNKELQSQLDSYKSKEGELLDFSERLSMKHMLLQTELDEALKRVPNYKDFYEQALKDKEGLNRDIEKFREQIEKLNLVLENERGNNEKLQSEFEANDKKHRNSIDELQNEIKVMRRKHQIAAKEMVKVIKQLQSQLEQHNNISTSSGNIQNSILKAEF